MSIQDINLIEMDIETAKRLIAKRDMVLKLESNREFKKLILEDLLVKEAARSAILYSDPGISEVTRGHCLRDIGGYGLIERYFRTIKRMAAEAEEGMERAEEELDLLRAEEEGVIVGSQDIDPAGDDTGDDE